MCILRAMPRRLAPLEVVFTLIGPPEVVGPILGIHWKSPYRWRNASKWRNAGDLPSARVMRLLLAYAHARSIPLTAEHLIWGATEDEIAALLPSPEVAAE